MPAELVPGTCRHVRRAGCSGRSVVHSRHGMIATSQPLAVQAGLDMLRQGGNAVDAAIAANAVLGVVEPMSCGMGGDLFAIVWEAHSGKLFGLNAAGRSPYRATVEEMRGRGLTEIPLAGPLSWSVPGGVDGWEALRARFGSRSLAELLEPAIAIAEEGFPVGEVASGMWQASETELAANPDSARTYLPAGRAPRVGEIFWNPDLAGTYRELARGGRDSFYRGRIARDLLSFSQASGGLLTPDDLADTSATWVEPVGTDYRGVRVWELPPPGQGITTLQMLNLLEPFDLRGMGPRSADYWHLFVEAKKVAWADRARFIADPEKTRIPVDELISKSYAAERRKLIDPRRAGAGLPPGEPLRRDTVYLAAVDAQRNCVSLIQSIYQHFGSGMVPGRLGFALQNRGSQFSLDPSHPNRLEPHKRPFHTIIPAFATRGGKPWLVFGVMGADMQPQGQVQVLVNLLNFGMNVQAAGEAPRIEHLGSPTPTGRPEVEGGGMLAVEEGIPEEVFAQLQRRGHAAAWVERNGGGYQGILIVPETGALQGGSEPRTDGCAAGY
ncbi:MAG TPA: gamma-glutamyltransferase [Myxococcales bacterium]|nr:gamma-glutamyltransferase [Myxococcales bacterium]